ncbi:MAG: low molecular weight phosphotyrosine protein phosphatase [Rivularia sp. (in: Bacteria)]|nr:low molecular weight phosphotyrosine protein phosphatase [Rivularia sp. MS3]
MAYKLLFVCLGNICRSPTAENVMNHLVEKAGLSNSINCDSAGTSSYHIGSPPDSRMSAAANHLLGIKLRGNARAFKSSDFENFDLILAMDKQNYRDILSMDSSGEYRDKVRLMCGYCRSHSLKEVPDPYYGGTEGFNQVVNLLVDACGGLLEDIRTTQVNL